MGDPHGVGVAEGEEEAMARDDRPGRRLDRRGAIDPQHRNRSENGARPGVEDTAFVEDRMGAMMDEAVMGGRHRNAGSVRSDRELGFRRGHPITFSRCVDVTDETSAAPTACAVVSTCRKIDVTFASILSDRGVEDAIRFSGAG